MRVIATVAVVLIHVAGGFVLGFGRVPMQSWWIGNVVDSCCRWAVPVFIMLSGALLLDPHRNDSPGAFYRKRLARVGIPLVFWVVFYLLAVPPDAGLNIHGVLVTLFIVPYYHLYFLYIICGLYAFTPALRAAIAALPYSTGRMLAVAVLCLGCLNALYTAYNAEKPILTLVLFVPYIGYYCLGYYLRSTTLNTKKRIVAWVGFIAAVAVTAVGERPLVGSYGTKSLGVALYDYLSPSVIVMSYFAYLLISGCFSSNSVSSPRSGRLGRAMGADTLGVYLIHPEVLNIMNRFGFHLGPGNPVLYILTTTIVILVVSFAFVEVIRRTPYLRAVVGN